MDSSGHRRKSQFCVRYYLAFPPAESLIVTLPELDGKILEYHRILESLPRPDPNRPTLLLQLAGLQCQRIEFSNLRKAITTKLSPSITEAVLVSQTKDIVQGVLRSCNFTSFNATIHLPTT
jgi:hypothetical protein